MVGRVSTQLVALLLGIASSQVLAQSTVLVDYNFDDQLLQPGPDTYRVFKAGGSRAAISYDIAQTGVAALHLSDPAFDGDFVEFQGYFSPQTSGGLTVEFGFLLTDVEGVFHFALVGEDKYKLGSNGINLWLFYDGEWLRTYSNSIPVKTIQPRAFQWYTVRADLDLDKRSYSLQVIDEHGQTLVSRADMILAPGRHSAHHVREYSFVGDIHDKSPGDFFIDNFSIRSSNQVEKEPLVAPGRKKLFVDRWKEYQRAALSKLRCLPARDLNDFSIDIEALVNIFGTSQMPVLWRLTEDGPLTARLDIDELHPSLRALQHWHHSCAMLSKENFEAAETEIDRALAISPEAFIFQLTRTIIRARKLSTAEAFYDISNLDQEDMRKDIALAMISLHGRSDEDEDGGSIDIPVLPIELAERLQGLSDQQRQEISRNETALAVERLKLFMPVDWEAYLSWFLALEQHYFQLLGSGDYWQAGQFADEVAGQFASLSLGEGLWRERAGDAALLSGQPDFAIQHYQMIDREQFRRRVELKLSDAYFMNGDFDKERALRESIYNNFDRH